MKKIPLLFILSLFLIGCGGDSDSPIPDPDPTPTDLDPVAVNDSYTAVEDSELIISDLLSNDTVVDNAVIKLFDETSVQEGTIVDNRDGTYSYTPASSFIGVDTFTYTLCDNDTPTPHCSTATVTITVEDEGSPIAVDDSIATVKNTVTIIDTVLENDSLIDDAVLSSVDHTNTSGTVVLNNDGTITYTPPTDFLGEDTFTYTICDDDNPEPTCDTATVTITIHEPIAFNIPAELQSYYEDASFVNIAELLYSQLATHTTNKHTTILSYGQRHNYLYNADEDETNTDNVILMYTGESRYWEEYTSGTNSYSPQTFNTEHVYPQSKLNANDAVTDLHHLRACDGNINSLRSNYSFTSGSGTYKLEDQKWFPGDDWKGDVARMIMYLNIRYGETFESVGTIDLFLEWNISDPVSTFEIQRNTVIYGAQGNRNPFIDNPYLATIIWGGNSAENKWE